MKCFALAVAAALLAAGSAPCQTECRVWPEVGTRKVLRDAPVPERPQPIDLDALRNEFEAFQVIVSAGTRDVVDARVSVSDLVGETGALIGGARIALSLQHYLEVTQNTSKPGWYPDALLPLPESFSVKAGQNQGVWANVYVPRNAAPGRYVGKVTVAADGQVTELPVTLRVRDAALTDKSHFQSAFAIWGGILADQYKLSQDSPEYRALYERVYWFLTGYRMPPDDLPVSIDSPDAARFLNDPRVNSFRIPYDPGNPEQFKQRIAMLREKGWLSKGYIYTIDEPGPDAIAGCAEYGKRIKELAPDARWLLTHGVREELLGAVSIWCPVLAGYDKDACRERQALGESVWWYTCCGPQHPYPTYLINDDATSPRVLSWLQAAWKVEGVLYWSVNIWDKFDGQRYVDRDVWTDPLAFPGANGDGYLIYPGKTHEDPPIPSLRLEWIRQGNEDFETFWLLRDRLREEAEKLEVPPERYDPHSEVEALIARVAPTFTRWNRDPLAMEAARREALDRIEATGQSPRAVLWTSVPGGPLTPNQTVSGVVWSEPGSQVTVTAQGEGTGPLATLPVLSEPATSRRHETWRFSLQPTDYVTRLTVSVEKDGTKRTFTRLFTLPRPLARLEGDMLCAWTKPEDVKKWALSSVEADVTERQELGPCAKLTYKPNVEFPNIRLLHPDGFADPDWTKRGYLVLSFYNPHSETVGLTLKLFTKDGKAQDGLSIELPPKEASRFSWSVKDDFTIDMSQFAGFELWMWNKPKTRMIYLGPVLTTTERPTR